MKIIDLLNKIANGEKVPNVIKYQGSILSYDRQNQDYYCEKYGNLFEYLISERITSAFLNNEVEIIEEDNKDKKINRLEILDWEAFKIMTAGDKYELYKNIITIMNVFIDCINNSYEDNDLIDKINSLENKQ